MNRVLVTGGAGYIGSHVVKKLGEAGHAVVTLDNLSKGFREAVLYGDLVVGNTGDYELVTALLETRQIDTVLHFAASTVVPESVADPLKYYRNNTANSRSLLASCRSAGVKRFVFSSTAAVYGIPDGDGVVDETAPTRPINPYGRSKLMTEWMLEDLGAAGEDFKYVILRYFNVAGSDPDQKIGQNTPDATLLIKVACEVAAGLRESITIFGTDYPTPDGTGVRDYIHVDDLADAHLKALDYLAAGGTSTTLNCGYGHGYSVREVLDSVARISNQRLNVIEGPRRAGDPPSIVAKAERITQKFDWLPHYDDLDFIVQTALSWESKRLKQSS